MKYRRWWECMTKIGWAENLEWLPTMGIYQLAQQTNVTGLEMGLKGLKCT